MLGKSFFSLIFWIVFFYPFSPLLVFAASINEVDAIPHIDSAGKESYRDFLTFDKHRAFAIAPGGTWSWKGGEPTPEAAEKNTLQACRDESGQACILYALDDKVVFDTLAWSRLWGPYLNRSAATQARVGRQRGNRFTNLAFKNASGKFMKLSDLRGKVIVLHFWGSWCPPCRNEMPELQQLNTAMEASPDIQLVLLQVQEDFETSRRWVLKQHLNLPLYDSGTKSKAMDTLTLADGKKLHDREIAPGFPTTYILDKHGIVVFSNIGPISRWSQYMPLLRDVAARSGK